MILAGYLGGRYAQDLPLNLAASLTFEQSYEGVEGDSASSAELYALLSSLADVPLRQVAKPEYGQTPDKLFRENQMRVAWIGGDVGERDIRSTTSDVRKEIAKGGQKIQLLLKGGPAARTSELAAKPLKVTAEVSDPSGIKWVRLRYRSVSQYEDYKSLDMIETKKKGQYKAVVPGEDIVAKWDFMYLIEVMDNKGNGKIYPDLEKEAPYVIVKLQR